MNTKKNILWITYGALMAERGYFTRLIDEKKCIDGLSDDYINYLVAFETFSTFKLRREFRKKHGHHFENSYSFPTLPNRNVLFLFLNIVFSVFVLSFLHFIIQPNICYCQGIRAAFSSLLCPFIRNEHVISDLHGLHVDESIKSQIYSSDSFICKLDLFIQKYSYLNSGKIVFVSNEMKLYFNSKYGHRGNFSVIPCSYNSNNFFFSKDLRQQIRTELEVESATVLIYSGSFASWQCLPEVLAFYQRFKAFENETYLLILSKDNVEILNTAIMENGNLESDRIIYKSVNQEDVFKYLSAADIAIALRDQSDINRVASPTKIGEYLACGLPVVISPGVGDYSEVIDKFGLGYTIEDGNFSSDDYRQVKKIIIDSSDACISYAKSHLSWNTTSELIGTLLKYVPTDD